MNRHGSETAWNATTTSAGRQATTWMDEQAGTKQHKVHTHDHLSRLACMKCEKSVRVSLWSHRMQSVRPGGATAPMDDDTARPAACEAMAIGDVLLSACTGWGPHPRMWCMMLLAA